LLKISLKYLLWKFLYRVYILNEKHTYSMSFAYISQVSSSKEGYNLNTSKRDENKMIGHRKYEILE